MDQQKIYQFEDFELDARRYEIRRAGQRLHVEPQVLSLLLCLIENRDKMLTKDDVINQVWQGRFVSESAVAARIKSARKIIGDNGKEQRLIKTIHGRGFRFVGDVVEIVPQTVQSMSSLITTAEIGDAQQVSPSTDGGKPTIAVLPFHYVGDAGPQSYVADALPADIISDLSRLHWLSVIARGSSFRFRGADQDPIAVGSRLTVRYCLMGTVELDRDAVSIGVSLIATGSGEILWSESYKGALRDLQQMRPEIEAKIVASLTQYIPQNEVKLARNKPSNALDAWGSFHLGVDHMYRFTLADNGRAAELFQHSLSLDPYFSRSLAGLSFTHFQNAFMSFGGAAELEREEARRLANKALEVDRLDPFAHFSAGRVCWLDGQLHEAVHWFDSATSISPSYAQGHYNRGLVNVLAGKASDADRDLAQAIDLSPIDPLGYAMVSSRSLVQFQLQDYEKAARLAAQAARMPGAHKHIELIAAFTAEKAKQHQEALYWLNKARQSDPNLTAATFFQIFPFTDEGGRAVIEDSLRKLGV